MKTFRATTGPFAERPYYEIAEVERICTQELRKQKLYPAGVQPIRIDRFVEKRFGIQPTYEDLPKGVLGFTRFGAKGVEAIVVARSLDDEGTTTAERRLRTTLAHEGGHGLLHTHLFAFGNPPTSLFGNEISADDPKILCRDEQDSPATTSGKRRPPVRWWEFQANMAMGALLLPRALVLEALATMLVPQGRLGLLTLPDGCREAAARSLADVFDVNPIVARIRLQGLYPVASGGQLTL